MILETLFKIIDSQMGLVINVTDHCIVPAALTSHERNGVSNHRKMDCMFHSLV